MTIRPHNSPLAQNPKTQPQRYNPNLPKRKYNPFLHDVCCWKYPNQFSDRKDFSGNLNQLLQINNQITHIGTALQLGVEPALI